jgi:hypothetical protein
METRAAVRRAAEQRRAAEEFTNEWLRRQGPGAAVALERIQNATRNGDNGDTVIDPGPVARATEETFLSPRLSENTIAGKRPASPSMTFPYLPPRSDDSSSLYVSMMAAPIAKQRRIATRSYTRRSLDNPRVETFERAIVPVVSSGFLEWHEFLRIGCVNHSCRAIWLEQRESYGPWSCILRELNTMNCTNKCTRCEQVVLLKSNRSCCDINQWTRECAKRTPDFISCVDILMSSGYLTWRQRGGIRRICKGTYRVHKEQCTCQRNFYDRSPNRPFLKIDPRFQVNYDEWTDYEKCEAMIRYTRYMIRNLHSFYNFRKLADENSLPYGLSSWEWSDIQTINLQRQCPKRYVFVMNLVSLYTAQNELQRRPPIWYASAFLGTEHRPYNATFADAVSSEVTDQCLPPTDENLVKFLKSRCYPTPHQQKVLGPLVNSVCIFSPLFKRVPLETGKRANLPASLETLNEQLIESMSQHMICMIM